MKYKNEDIINQFKDLGTSDGEGGLEFPENDNYYIREFKNIDSFVLIKIDIDELIKLDNSLLSYVEEGELREYFDDSGYGINHNDEDIYFIDGIIDGLNVPPIVLLDESNLPYVADGFNRILQHKLNGTKEIDMFVDERVLEIHFKEQNNELDF